MNNKFIYNQLFKSFTSKLGSLFNSLGHYLRKYCSCLYKIKKSTIIYICHEIVKWLKNSYLPSYCFLSHCNQQKMEDLNAFLIFVLRGWGVPIALWWGHFLSRIISNGFSVYIKQSQRFIISSTIIKHMFILKWNSALSIMFIEG